MAHPRLPGEPRSCTSSPIKKRHCLWIAVLLGLGCGCVHSAERDPDLPEPLAREATEALLRSSPFTRSLNIADSVKLTGIAEIGSKHYVTVFDIANNKHHILSQEPNAEGWKLLGVYGSQDKSYAKISVGGEAVTIRFPSDQSHSGGSAAKSPRENSASAGGNTRPGLDDETRLRFEALPQGEKFRIIQEFHDRKYNMRDRPQAEKNAFMRRLVEHAEKNASKN